MFKPRPRMYIPGIVLVISLISAAFIQDAAANNVGNIVFLPLVLQNYPPNTAFLADHRHTDIHAIPDVWIDEARKFVVHYAHTSHGSQVLSGLNWLEQQDPKYNVSIRASGLVALPSDSTALGFYDGNNYSSTTYITPDKYWESQDGINHTRSVIETGWFDFSLWTWCGQMSSYSVTQVQTYLDVLAQLENDYSGTRVIYYTGHTDGSQPGSVLWRNNDMVRDFTSQNNKILFDFADIESYDPDGNFYPTATDACHWCDDWCDAHPGAFECQDLPSCSHTHGLQCTLKGQAFWYLMARLAGWDGN